MSGSDVAGDLGVGQSAVKFDFGCLRSIANNVNATCITLLEGIGQVQLPSGSHANFAAGGVDQPVVNRATTTDHTCINQCTAGEVQSLAAQVNLALVGDFAHRGHRTAAGESAVGFYGECMID